MTDDDIGELVLTVIHLQVPLASGKFHAPVLVPGYILLFFSTIIYHKIHILRFAMEYVWLEFKARQFSRDFKWNMYGWSSKQDNSAEISNNFL